MGESPDPDDVMLSDGWQSGVYPYRNLMSRKAYDREKSQLQVELLKLQAWCKDAGERLGHRLRGA